MRKHRKPVNRTLGEPPGSVPALADSGPTDIECFEFTPGAGGGAPLNYVCLEQVDARHKSQADSNRVLWVNVEGLGDHARLLRLADIFQIHQLALEDVWNQQRPKIENYNNHILAVVQLPRPLPVTLSAEEIARGGPTTTLDFEQIAIFMGKGFVLTVQEGTPGDCFDGIRRRFEDPNSDVRNRGADYLCYLILDAVVDSYFPLVEQLEARIDQCEDEIFNLTGTAAVAAIRQIKRDVNDLERRVRPMVEALSNKERLLRAFVEEETRLDLRDCLDHARFLQDNLASQRDLAAGLMDAYMSTMTHRTNEVMRTLTLITTLFMPLSFIAALYGMNFSPDASPYNMPELRWRYGYFYSLGLMLAVACTFGGYSYRRNWIGFRRSEDIKFLGWKSTPPPSTPVPPIP